MTELNGSGTITQRFPHLAPDDDLLKLMEWAEELETKVDDFGNRLDIWTNAILKQTNLSQDQNKLIVSLGLTLDQTAKSNATFGETLVQLKQDLLLLKNAFKTLIEVIDSQGSQLQHLSDLMGSESQTYGSRTYPTLFGKLAILNKKLETLETQINNLPQSLNTSIDTAVKKLTARIDKLEEGWNSERFWVRLALVPLLLFSLLQLYGLTRVSSAVHEQAAQINGNVNTALIRLQRLEGR